MGKILESLPLTIAAGVILTVVMIFATEAIYDSQMSAPEKAVSNLIDSM
ncbi:MAG: hypothetical protein JKY84_08925 [Emcibacteraceae bacterium]|nr:hypothetical protein [Emcibacteraceae bacterium]